MKYKYNLFYKKSGFTMIESLVYIFLTTIILVEGINVYVSIYKYYIDKISISSEYNNYQKFFIDIENIIDQGTFEKITVEDNTLLFFEKDNENVLQKKIKSYAGNVVVKYMNTKAQPIIVMLEDIDSLEVTKKGKLIYLKLKNKEGKEFIKCI